jgi:glycosyltransferase involved in cell wall biosynthesis
MTSPQARPRLIVNALALRPGGDAARTFLESVLRELPGAWRGEVVALVRDGVQLDTPAELVAVAGVGSGLTRIRAERARLASLVHDLEPDVFLNPNESVPRGVAAPLVVVAQNLLFHCAGAGPLSSGPPIARIRSRLQFAYYRHQMPRAYRRATVVACVSEHARDLLARRAGLEVARTRVVRCGADRLTVGAREEASHVLIAVGVVAEYKRLDIAVRALAQLPSTYSLRLVGEEWPGAWEPLRRLAATLGLADRVERATVATDGELSRLYAQSRALLAPSACESFGVPVAEAMYAGLPVVAVDEPWSRELATGAALLVPPEPAAFASAVLALEDAGERRRRSDAGRVMASSLTWRRTAEGLAAAAREALAAP